MIDERCPTDSGGASQCIGHLLVLAARGRIAARMVVYKKKTGRGLPEHRAQNVSR